MTRRWFLLAGTAFTLLASKAKAWFPHGFPPPQYNTSVHLFETTMVAPDIICFEIRDQEIPKGTIYSIPTQPANNGGWYTIGGVLGHIISPALSWFKAADTLAVNFLDRITIDNPANWPTIGGLTVTNVYRKSYPYDSGVTNASALGGQGYMASMRHYVYCQLSGNLSQGTYTITFPSGIGLSSVGFTFNDMTTRCHSIRVTQVGNRPSDGNKCGYLAVWLPGYGTNGAIDFATTYSLTDFKVIDANGSTVGTPFAGGITLRNAPTVAETQASPTLQYIGETGLGIRTVSAVTYTSTCQITTATSHSFSGGERVQFRGMGASNSGTTMQLNYYIGIVGSIVDSTNFMLLDTSSNPVVSTGFTHWLGGVFGSEYDSQLVVMTQKNRAGTYVFSLDYSSLAATDLIGTMAPYRVQIPGLGVSYPFAINDANWYGAAKVACGGYYNQIQGIALDGRFGYSRPAAFIDGQNSCQIYWSTMLAAFSTECQFGSPQRDFGYGAYGPWATTIEATGIYGGYRDAGDWSVLLTSHAIATYSLLNTYEIMGLLGGGGGQSTNWNFPRMSQVLDPTLYAGTDGLPDLVHAAMWEIDMWRRTQILWNAIPGLPSQYQGGISGAFLYGNAAPGDGGSQYEPSWLTVYPAYLCSPDHASNYYGAFLFAKAALVFQAAGFTGTGSLTDVYTQAAEAAWLFAENMCSTIVGSYATPDYTAEDAYYNGYLNFSNNFAGVEQAGSITCIQGNTTLVGTSTHFTSVLTDGQRFFIKYMPDTFTVAAGGVLNDTHVVVTVAPTVNTPVMYPGIHWGLLGQNSTAFDAEMDTLDSSSAGVPEALRGRSCAAGALYRLLGDTVGAAYKTAFESMYVNVPSKVLDYGFWEYINGPTPNSTYKTAFTSGKRIGLNNQVTSAENSTNAYFGANITENLLSQYYGYVTSTDPTLLPRARKYWQAQLQFLHGANQYGYCMCTGLGSRNIEWGMLCQDRTAQGIKQPEGAIPYGWWNIVSGPGAQGNFASGDSALNFTLDFPLATSHSSYPAYYVTSRGLQPNRFDVPVWEFITEIPLVIQQMEFTTEQTIIPHWSLACILSSWDGNPGH